ncbi:integrator complex subunit 6 [Lingula anatina]|uniref:Integrator complex subunit 6 n=1 Tax=Lingula anatina TaxID=7574 RepID=A0A1S3IRE4_LINAN|nr:integrator complex subunit 6 [Lingula anatina]|eukprot:XP_013400785.1 integrator complex subunit 6 [Lingula anatina]
MTIILFLIDTSGSMNQRTYLGTTLLDVTKGAVENFMKIRSRDPACRGDRYMLLTFEDPPANVKAGWKESHATFIHELKNLEAFGLTSMGTSLKYAFDLLNVNRIQSGVDNYGQGRCPFFMEPAVIICFTDGKKLTSSIGAQTELNLPMNNLVPGSELTREPFRWDQRLYGIVLRMPATPPPESALQGLSYIHSAEDSLIDEMCEVTGGRSYCISNHRMLVQCLESVVQKVQPGVVINFEKIGADPSPVNTEAKLENGQDATKENLDSNMLDVRNPVPEEKRRSQTPTNANNAWQNCRRLIYVHRSAQKGYMIGHWPIPENFWPDLNSPTLTPRSAHPNVKFSCTPCDPMAVENFPFDKYELEPSPLTQYILERRQPNACWQVFVSNSAKYSDIGHPFGYLKPSSNLTMVNLIVMPYNYPVLLPLLEDLFKVHKLKPNQRWRQQFDNYLKTMPVYYAGPLRRALSRMGVPNLVPENMENCLSYSVISYLKKLKNQAKQDYDRLVASVGQKIPLHEGIKVQSRSQTSLLERKDLQQLMQHYGGSISVLKEQLSEYSGFSLGVPDRDIQPQMYRNPFDIPRTDLLDQISRMRANYLQPSPTGTRLVDDDQMHSIPVQEMGNYQEYLKKAPQPLREIDTQPVRLHMFGNPFKVNKNIMIDEADEAMPGQQKMKRSLESPPSSPGPKRRKPGPLPKDIKWRPGSPSIGQQMEAQKCDDSKVKEQETNHNNLIAKDNNHVIKNASPEPIEMNNHFDASDTESVNSDTNSLSPPTIVLDGYTSQGEEDNLRGRLSPMSKLQQQKQEAQAIAHNKKLRRLVVREVKQPGKNYAPLFQHLGCIQGNLDLKLTFLRDVIHEASRFKKRALIEMLEQFEETLVKKEMGNNNRQNNCHNVKVLPGSNDGR